MSAWVKARNAGQPTPVGVQATLGRCRSMAYQAKQADAHANAGNDLKAQALRSRVAKAAASDAPITKAERSAKAKSMLAERAKRNAARNAKAADDWSLSPTKPAVAKARVKAERSAKAPKPTAAPKAAAKPKVSAGSRKLEAKAVQVAGGENKRGYIADLRASLGPMPDAKFDAMLLKAQQEGVITLYGLDAPAEEAAARRRGRGWKTPLGVERFIYYAGGRGSH